ncbi:MAG: hypothetical protein JO001_02140 [Alphaproteobacteria bacterium]|nr:hypothetical protein [Alphaproteobacteria bacterium]
MGGASQVQPEDPDPASAVRLLIAGTGRAGTSFLVRLLTELGLDTHVSRFGDGAWDEAAQAGLEFDPAFSDLGELPQVIKSPWAYQFIGQMLAEKRIELSAAIIPMRDLVEAAASRTIIELRAMHKNLPWMARMHGSWSDWGHTPGGTVFSLNPLDQSRLLAVGFHRLIEQLVEADVPILFLAFPRFAEDADYMYDKLAAILPPQLTREELRRAHRRIARHELIRVGRELRRDPAAKYTPDGMPTLEQLDNSALRREVARLRECLAEADIRRPRDTRLRRVARVLALIASALAS